MKQTLWFLIAVIAVIALSQDGCTFAPSIDETSRQDMKNDRAIQQSDAFARSLPP
jgi:hypothetical protein